MLWRGTCEWASAAQEQTDLDACAIRWPNVRTAGESLATIGFPFSFSSSSRSTGSFPHAGTWNPFAVGVYRLPSILRAGGDSDAT